MRRPSTPHASSVPWTRVKHAADQGWWATVLDLVGDHPALTGADNIQRMLGLVSRAAARAEASVVDALLGRTEEPLLTRVRRRAWVVARIENRADAGHWHQVRCETDPEVFQSAVNRRAWSLVRELMDAGALVSDTDLGRVVVRALAGADSGDPLAPPLLDFLWKHPAWGMGTELVVARKAVELGRQAWLDRLLTTPWGLRSRSEQPDLHAHVAIACARCQRMDVLDAVMARHPWNDLTFVTALKLAASVEQEALFDDLLARSVASGGDEGYGQVASQCIELGRLDLMAKMETQHPLESSMWSALVIQALKHPDPSVVRELVARTDVRVACLEHDHGQIPVALLGAGSHAPQRRELAALVQGCFDVAPIEARMGRWIQRSLFPPAQLREMASWMPLDIQTTWAARWPTVFNPVLAATRSEHSQVQQPTGRKTRIRT